MQHIPLHPFKKIGPLFESAQFKDMKDPCIVYDGSTWHIYGSGGDVEKETWCILHATASVIEGPWTEHEPVVLLEVAGPHVAAPGVIYDPGDNNFHMCIQEDFMALGGCIHYLVSSDGHTFSRVSTVLESIAYSGEAGLYDPHFSVINNEKYLVYAGMPGVIHHSKPFIPQPDIYLAKSETGLWAGPWRRIQQIVNHEDISWHHNQPGHPDYEWGIEGPQCIELPNGKILLNATCFLEEGKRGTRQRVFFALADTITGPYTTIGPVLTQKETEWESGENGHACTYIKENILYLFYQARSQRHENPINNPWRYGIALFNIDDIYTYLTTDREGEIQQR